MAKKDKNSLLNIHYSRTMTSDNLSKASNYVGKYVLKGLGAFGKIMTAPFVQLGPTSATIYKSKKLLAKEKAIELKSEKLLGKAMTWVSPLNYGAALATGNGLNARKGEEEVASWSPAWQAVGRLGELYAGPKIVKGVKATPRVVVNTAAKAGVKPAKAAVVAREIKLATKNKPKYTRVPSKNLFRTQVYKGGEITDPYSNFVTTDPLYATNYGKVTPYIFESKSVAKAKEPMMGSSDPVTMDMFVYNNTKGNPNATAIIGHDKVTGEFAPSRGIEIYSMSPTNLFKINNSRKGKIFTGFEEQQRLLDMLNNSYNTPHPPIYERVSYSKYSADAANPKDIIRLFRATGTSGKFKPSLDGTQEFVGQWFTNDIRKPLKYASSTFKKAKISKESNPVELQVVEIPTSEINKYKASELLKGRTDVEYEPTEDFLIPLDYPRLKYPIEGLTGNLLLDMRLKLPIEKQGGKMNILEFLKNGSGIHIKEKNKGSFTRWCGGNVTEECIRRGKNSSNPKIRKKATFADNARHFKHRLGGSIVETLGGGNTITAKLKAKANLTKRKAPDWDNLDRGYRYLTLDMKLPHDLAIAVMGNVVEESQGDYKAALKNGRGRGLIQWDGRPAPKGRYGQWGSIWASVAKKANVYDPDTDTVKNYWAPWNGLKGDLVRLKFISAPLKLKTRIYAESYLRPGKPRIVDRQLSAMQLDSIYNPKIKNIVVQLKEGGTIDFLSLGGWVKNTFNNVSSFLGSDAGKSVLSIGSGLLGLGKGISNSGKIADAANEAEEAINALESADRLKSFAEKYASILLEKLSKPDIDVNGSPIHTNGVNVTNEAYNLAVNTFNFDNSKYNQMRLLIRELAKQALGKNSSSMIGSVGGLIDSIGGIAGSLLNKTPKTSLVITGTPDSSKQVITTNSGMSGTVDDWRKAIMG